MKLSELKIGQKCKVVSVGGHGALRQHFLDMGVIPSTQVRVVKFAPMGDPMQIRVHGYELTLRLSDAAEIEVEYMKSSREERRAERRRIQTLISTPDHAHPGLGESGKFHDKKQERPLPDGTNSHLPLWETRTAERPLSSISSQAQTNTWATSLASP